MFAEETNQSKEKVTDQSKGSEVKQNNENETNQSNFTPALEKEVTEEKRIKKPNKLLIISIVIIVFILLGGGVWAYKQYFSLNSEKLFLMAANNFKHLDSFHYQLNVGVTSNDITNKDKLSATSSDKIVASSSSSVDNTSINDSENKAVLVEDTGLNNIFDKFSFSAVGDVNKKDSNNLKSKSILKLNLGESFGALNLELINIGGEGYVKIDSSPGLIEMFIGSLSAKWIHLNEKMVNNSKLDIPNIPKITKLNTSKTKESFKNVVGLDNINIKNYNIEKFAGQETYHFTFSINRNGVVNILNAFKKDFPADSNYQDLNMNIKGGIWINKSNKQFNHIVINANYFSKKEKKEYNITISISLSKYNKNINIIAPKESQDLTKVLDSMMGSFMGDQGDNLGSDEQANSQDNNQPGEGNTGIINPINDNSNDNFVVQSSNINTKKNIPKDSDFDGLTDSLETFYHTDPLNPDTDGDGYQDGAEIFNGYNPLGAGKLSVDTPKGKMLTNPFVECYFLKDDSQKNTCYLQDFSKLVKANDCDKALDPDRQNYYKDLCYSMFAEKSKDINICSSIDGLFDRKQCYINLVSQPGITCESLINSSNKAECLNSI